MILVDTSAWVEFLRATDSSVHRSLEALVREEARLVVTDVVAMELLAGESSRARALALQRFLVRFDHVPTEGPGDFEDAAELYRTCRAAGDTIRSLLDCLIAAVAIRTRASVLHRDRAFGAIARHSRLTLHNA